MTTAPADAVLLLDGVFLLRPELIGRWDLSIFVSAAFEQTLDRARTRDLARLGSAAEVERRFRTRYIPAQKLYFATARPADHADIIVHNDEPRRPLGKSDRADPSSRTRRPGARISRWQRNSWTAGTPAVPSGQATQSAVPQVPGRRQCTPC